MYNAQILNCLLHEDPMSLWASFSLRYSPTIFPIYPLLMYTELTNREYIRRHCYSLLYTVFIHRKVFPESFVSLAPHVPSFLHNLTSALFSPVLNFVVCAGSSFLQNVSVCQICLDFICLEVFEGSSGSSVLGCCCCSSQTES